MARQPEFERSEVLQKAMELFWEKGYEATTLNDLLAHTGIKRQSLYNTFGNKHELYLEALERYRGAEGRTTLAPMFESGPIRDRLRRMYQNAIEEVLCDPNLKGCFITNATLELATRDEATGKLVSTNLAGAERLFVDALAEAQAKSEIPENRDVRALARHFLNSLNGLRVTSKVTQDREMLEDVAESALLVLD